MKYTVLIISIIAFVAMVSFGCNKEKKDTCINPEIPGDYFPAYPNTWWEYRDNNNALIKYRISSSYEDCEKKCRPVFLNINKCIDGNSLIYGFGAGLGTWAVVESPIYSLNIGDTLICPISFSTFKITPSMRPPIENISFRRVLLKKDTSIAVNGIVYNNVILMKEYSLHDSLHLYYDYFSKDIGLIKRDSITQIDTSIWYNAILTLDNYYIGK
jgi:hypothetical protein